MSIERLFLTFIFPFCLLEIASAQSSFEQQPKLWEAVRFYQPDKQYMYDKTDRRSDYYNFEYKKRNKDVLWMVFSINAKTDLLDSPKEKAKVVSTAPFSTAFYVKGEKNGYLEIEGASSDNKDLSGWCNKKDLIFWDRPLLDAQTRIELKAFLVNRVERKENFKTIKAAPEQYFIYQNADGGEIVNTNLLYDVLFVFAYSNPQNIAGQGRYLVSKSYLLSSSTSLMGWVSEERVKLWTTSLCIEPNFTDSALMARRNAGVAASIFPQGDQEDLNHYLETGEGEGMIDNSSDPAFGNYKVRPRMKGELMRYPVFYGDRIKGKSGKFDNSIIGTGVSAKINPSNTGVLKGLDSEEFTALSEKAQKMAENVSKKNVNIVLLLDGSSGMKRYGVIASETINSVQEQLGDANIKYGAVLYRNEFISKADVGDSKSMYCYSIPLSNNPNEIRTTIENWSFREDGDPGHYEAVYYAFNKATQMLKPYETNIIIHLGNAPDRSDKFMGECQGKTCITASEIATGLDENTELHYIGFATYLPNENNTQKQQREILYSQINNGLLNEVAKAQNNRLSAYNYAKDGTQVVQPSNSEMDEGYFKESSKTNIPFLLNVYYQKTAGGGNDIKTMILADIDSCFNKQADLSLQLLTLTNPENKIGSRAGSFSEVGFKGLNEKLKELDSALERDEFITQSGKEQFQIFQEASSVYYTDALPGLPLFQYVVFYPEDKLKETINLLDGVLGQADKSTGSKLVELLEGYWRAVAEKELGGSDYESLTLQQIRRRITGIENMQLELPEIHGKIGDLTIDNLKKVEKYGADEQRLLYEQFQKRKAELESLKNSEYYFLPPKGNKKFYWVPIELIYG